MVSEAAKPRRIRLADILVRSTLGLSPEKVINAIRVPVPKHVAVNWAQEPDDDGAIRQVTGPGTGMLHDPRRNLGWYDGCFAALTVDARPGDLLEVDTFDGWLSRWSTTEWTATVVFTEHDGRQTSHSYRGGVTSGEIETDSDFAVPPNYYTDGPWFTKYHDNGFLVLWPHDWPVPDFLGGPQPLSGGSRSGLVCPWNRVDTAT